MSELEYPSTLNDLVDAVKSSDRARACGNQSKSALSAGCRISLKGYTGVTQYEPAEFTITVKAGTPTKDIEKILATNNQYLPFDPAFAESSTIGGAVATGLCGPGRFRYGGIRDFVLAALLVTGPGEVIRGGAPVVKNAAGFDLPKLMVGSLGRLGVLTEITFKVFPRPQSAATLRVQCSSPEHCQQLIAQLVTSNFDLTCLDGDHQNRLWIRVAGWRDALAGRVKRIQEALAVEANLLDAEQDAKIWNDATEFRWVANDCGLVKVPLTPRRVCEVLKQFGDVQYRLGVGGNVMWLAWPVDREVIELEGRLSALGLSALVVSGNPRPTREPPNALFERIRLALDPSGKFKML